MLRISLFVLGMIVPVLGMAAPIARAGNDATSIVLTDEDCGMKSVVVNLPKRAIWTEDGKTFEGCWGVHPQTNIITMYFDDKTVTSMPAQMFTRIGGA